MGADEFQIGLPLPAPSPQKQGCEVQHRVSALAPYQPDKSILTEQPNGDTNGLFRADRGSHVYVIGRTGTGKSTLLKNLQVQDIEAGEGFSLIDPHGDLSRELLDLIPSHRTRDVIYFDPSDQEFPIGLNLLDAKHGERPDLVTSALVSSFKSIWGESWGPRMEHILAAAIMTLAEAGKNTLMGIQRILVDDQFRKTILKRIQNPELLSFWKYEFGSWDPRSRSEKIAPIQNKVGQLLMSPLMRNILGQQKRVVDFRHIMDRKKIFIANLSKGKIGEDKSNLLGALLVASFQLAAMSREDTPEKDRMDHYLYVDEFQNFGSSAFESILSEARKYRLNLTISHQVMSQVPQQLLEVILGNVGSTIAFRLSDRDAGRIIDHEDKIFAGGIKVKDLISLRKFHAYFRILEEGEPRRPFIAKTIAPLGTKHGRAEKIIKNTRRKYAKSVGEVEQLIKRWYDPHSDWR